MNRTLKNTLVFALWAFAGQAWSADLVQILRDAFANDAQYASARATRDAGLEALPQGLAGLLPTISASAFTQMNNLDIDFRGALPSSNREGNSKAITFSLTQPVFNWNNIMVYREAGFKAAQAEAHSSIVAGLGGLTSTLGLIGASRSGNLPMICCSARFLISRSLWAAISCDVARS